MKLGKHGQFLVNFISAYVNGEMERWEFDLDYSGYVIDHFPSFETETRRLAVASQIIVKRPPDYSDFHWQPLKRLPIFMPLFPCYL
ncbi:hypothetical protein [Caproicibacter fermentans]|uniref:Uncharacterized protein n=1 Tax=Caproicibacter fermentans TaxID=2576756 RepID=A0A7G8TBP7_9FIRM|nr:hypothetical protein [Caproicibacter fermentans]QNK41038.1 hypothetical protein HCR03_01590 [Caproicibacter fermentans]